MKLSTFFTRMLRQETGTMTIETAFIAPVLIVMAIGGFEVSTMVARQTELQAAMAEAAAVARANLPETAEERTTLRDIIKVSADLENSQVGVTPVWRCGTRTQYQTSEGGCTNGERTTAYVRIVVSDTYQPLWTEFGLGTPVTYRLERTILIG